MANTPPVNKTSSPLRGIDIMTRHTSTSRPTQSTPKANHVWYKNHMVIIFVIGLPLLVVVACIYLVVYSVKIQDSVVRDDWYMDGKTLYQDVSRDTLLYELGITADMTIDTDGQINYYLHYPKESFTTGKLPDGTSLAYPSTLQIDFSHATDVTKDRNTTLAHQSDNHYTAKVDLHALSAKYYIQVSHDQPPNWRMRQIAKLPAGTTTNIQFEPLPSVISNGDDKGNGN